MLNLPGNPEDTFRELMLTATRGVEFSFSNKMYKRLDSVAMGSPFGPSLVNIFVGFHESRLFDNTAKPSVYFRYVDDSLSSLVPNWIVTISRKIELATSSSKIHNREGEQKLLAFSRCFDREKGPGFLTSIYGNQCELGNTSIGILLAQRQISLINTLVHRALMICSKTKLGQ